MADERWVLIANPVSGSRQAQRRAPELARRLSQRGIDLSLTWTGRQGAAEVLARQAVAQGATRVVACGGDGTVHEVVNGLLSTNAPPEEVALGIFPLGRCNDLASALHLPTTLSGTVQTLLQGVPRTIDVGRAGERYFTTVATLGFDSAVSQYVANGPLPSFLRGTVAYLCGILINLVRYRSVWVSLRGDFGDFQGPIFLAATGNTHSYAGGMKIVPPAQMDDGWLNVCLVRSVPRREVLRMLPRVFSGGHVTHPAVSLEWVRRLEITSREPLALWADGEPLAHTPTTIEVVPQALRVVVPQAPDQGA